MAMEEIKKKPLVDQDLEKKELEEKQESKIQVRPKYGAWTEGKEKLIIEVVLPGVKKENIHVKALKDYFMLRGMRDNIVYTLNLELNMEIEPDKIVAKYEEGLLRVELKRHNPLDDAFIVPINGVKREEQKAKEDKKKSWMLPEVLREVDYQKNTVYIEIAIPGVKEENIFLKVLPDWFNLTAERESVQFRANTGFGAEIVPSKTTAEYRDGLLKIFAQIHSPLDDAKKIALD